MIYNSGRYRMAGRGSLAGLMPYGDANAIVLEMAARGAAGRQAHAGACRGERHRPVPRMDVFLDQLKAIGFAGVQNFPTVGLIDGDLPRQSRGNRHGFRARGRDDRPARAKDLLTTPYVFNEAEAAAMAEAGADIIVCHMGLTTGGAIGAETALKLADCPARIDAWAAAALRRQAGRAGACHGGPIAEPEDADFILKHARHCHGFYGASSMERLPVERALTEQ